MLTNCPVTAAQARSILGEEPVGFRALTTSGPTCHDGCLAPGSSPHSHVTVTGWQIIGPTTIIEMTADGDLCIRSSSLHPFDA